MFNNLSNLSDPSSISEDEGTIYKSNEIKLCMCACMCVCECVGGREKGDRKQNKNAFFFNHIILKISQ